MVVDDGIVGENFSRFLSVTSSSLDAFHGIAGAPDQLFSSVVVNTRAILRNTGYTAGPPGEIALGRGCGSVEPAKGLYTNTLQ